MINTQKLKTYYASFYITRSYFVFITYLQIKNNNNY